MKNKSSHERQTVEWLEQSPLLRRYGHAMILAILILILACTTQLGAASATTDASTEAAGDIVYLPVTMKGYLTGPVPAGISGRVFVSGEAATDIALDLRYYDGLEWSGIDSTKTNEVGNYIFKDVGSLVPGEEYYVSYGGNESKPEYVYFWYGPTIDEYKTGDKVVGGVFDIADVPLVSPGSGTEAQLPVTLKWEKRNLVGDTYRVVVLDEEDDIYWRTIDLGNVDSYTVNVLAPDMLFNKQYSWYVEVYMGPDNFGESFMLNDIMFLPPSTPTGLVGDGTNESAFLPGSGRGGR